ncbi:helix-turn-helix domain-containing protein [Micromonospora marina]|uniref:helix-turn-helix domain-containing protein n=1 Tax=Micromonospora marina TaxID=307120 RepID=UPI000B86371B|nr:AraC family transcriptional regulator [Micromonospora marina]
MSSRGEVSAWLPSVDGIREVLHAHFTDHIYPMHTHDTWTLMVVDEGVVRYDLDRHEHGAFRKVVTLLPPNVPHNGHPATAKGFRKRVLYLDPAQLGEHLVGRAVDRPALDDPVLRWWIDRMHMVLADPGNELTAEAHLAFVSERLQAHLERRSPLPAFTVDDAPLAHRLRDLLDERFVAGVTLREASTALFASPTYLVRAFSREFGLGPHQYLISRRVDLARRLLLEGTPAGEVATAVGFYDQSHLGRHFKRILGFNPGQYSVGGPRRRPGRVAVRAPELLATR